jgi:putative endopeptidase
VKLRLPATLGLLCLCFASLSLSSSAQQSASHASPETALHTMPYSPSLDVTAMDKSVDPCQDFYQYSCGGWMKNNPIPSDQAAWDVYAKLTQDNERLLWGILEDTASATNRSATQQKIGDYFSSCMNTAEVDKAGAAPLESELDRIAKLNSADLAEFLAHSHLSQPGHSLFNLEPNQDFADSEKMIIWLGAGGLGLPDRDYYTKTDAKSQEIRQKYLDYIAQILGIAGESADQTKADAATVMQIETTLANASLTRVERREPHNLDHKMTVSQLSAIAPSFNWPKYLSALGLSHVETINVSQPEFFKALNSVLEKESLDHIKTYLRFHAVNAEAGFLSMNFQQASFDFFSKYLRGVPQMRPRWKKCVAQVDAFLGEALGQEFVRRTFGADMKTQTVKMTDEIEQSMQLEIEHLDWMSEPTKQQALLKLRGIRNKVGYPDKWRDYSSLDILPNDYYGNSQRAIIFEQKRQLAKVGRPVDHTEWEMTPPTVNAYYNPQMNDINFPAGVLQPPLYDAKVDDAPNYGDTGGTIGHELTHGFDDEGRKFDAHGNLKDWWTADDAKKFEERVQCVRDQYAQYVIVDDIHINSKLTSGEDVADLGGEILGYIAWKKANASQHLESREGFTPEQRFFIGFAQWACTNERPEQLRVKAITDPHSPGRNRINGVVVNMPQFREAFACKAGQAMVKEKICSIW